MMAVDFNSSRNNTMKSTKRNLFDEYFPKLNMNNKIIQNFYDT